MENDLIIGLNSYLNVNKRVYYIQWKMIFSEFMFNLLKTQLILNRSISDALTRKKYERIINYSMILWCGRHFTKHGGNPTFNPLNIPLWKFRGITPNNSLYTHIVL